VREPSFPLYPRYSHNHVINTLIRGVPLGFNLAAQVLLLTPFKPRVVEKKTLKSINIEFKVRLERILKALTQILT